MQSGSRDLQHGETITRLHAFAGVLETCQHFKHRGPGDIYFDIGNY